MRMGISYKRHFFIPPKKKQKIKKYFVIFLISSIILGSGYLFFERIYPNYVTRAENYINNMALRIVNNSIQEVLTGEAYQKFITSKKDEAGNISSIETDTVLMNKFRSDIIFNIQNQMANMGETYISIPLGSLLKNEIFSGLGPKIKIKILPTGYVKADFSDEFVSVGINQLKHKINLDTTLDFTLVSATMRKGTSVTQKIPVLETIISGEVPYYYGNGIISAK